MTKTIGYIRTSKNSQNLGVEVQKEALIRYKIDFFLSNKCPEGKRIEKN